MEIWKDVIGYKGIYKVSNLGYVKSLDHLVKHSNGRDRIQKGRFLKRYKSHKGYIMVSLSKNKTRFTTSVHRLMAIHFIDNPLNKPQVNHINGIKDDNRLCNLEWCTNSENQIHAVKNNLVKHNIGDKHHNAKLSNTDVKSARWLNLNGVSNKELALNYKVSETAMSKILRGITYKQI